MTGSNKLMKLKLLVDYLWTFGASLTMNILQLFLTRILAELLQKDTFGAYLLIKKITSFAIPLMTISLGQGLSKFILLNPLKKRLFIAISFSTLTGLTLSLLLISIPFLNEITQRQFGNLDYGLLTICVLLFSYASGLVALITDTLRGLDKIIGQINFKFSAC